MNIEELLNTNSFNKPLIIDKYKPKDLLSLLRTMLLIRKSEVKIADAKKSGEILGPVHLGVGQEAIAAGISKHLLSSDFVFGAHRSHSHLLALDLNPYPLFAEILGKATGHSKGMGGSMHLFNKKCGFYGSVPIVAGTVSLAVGAALASKLKDTNDIAVTYFGDGAAEEGVVHESLNLAKILNIPVIFVVENNLFASHMHITLRQPAKRISRFAEANEIPYRLIDGNDVVAISDAADELIKAARNRSGPGLIEAITYRWYGHVDWREDIDVGVDRSLSDIKNWKERDPIKRLIQALNIKGILSENEDKQLNDELDSIITKAWNKAVNDPYPNSTSIMEYVYA